MSNTANSIEQLKQSFKTKWAAMAPRERRIATVALWLVAVTLVVMVGIRPAWKTLKEAPAKIQQLDVQLEEMRQLAEESQGLRQRPPVPPAQAEAALKSVSERLGEAAKLTIQGDRATLNLNKVSGEELAAWLDEARGAARVRPVEAGLMQVEPGVYSGNIVVVMGPGAGGGQ